MRYFNRTIEHYRNYKKENEVRKLHLGAGNIHLEGWFNVDINPKLDNSIYFLNMLQMPYPFTKDSFDYIFSEHNFEHFTLKEMYYILKECLRILKPNGVLRIAIPDLKKLINFYLKNKKKHEEYCAFSIENYIPFAKEHNLNNKAIVLNNFFRGWGHKFIYDYETMKNVLEQCGYKSVHQCCISKSRHRHLKNLESHWEEIGKDFNNLETMVIEAKK